jgi:hypothetical protein
MARMSKKELEGIVERDLPGYKLASPEASDADRPMQAEPDDVGTDIDSLRQKYFGTDESEGNDNPGTQRNAPARSRAQRKRGAAGKDEHDKPRPNTDDELVAVQPKESGDPFDHAVRPKTVVISGEDGEIVGSQG